MTQVICYVEGSSDKLAMDLLLRPLIAKRAEEGVRIQFFETPAGDRKKSILLKGPTKALNILGNRGDAYVALIPDLYPQNRGFPHETLEELREGIFDHARGVLKKKGLEDEVLSRLEVFCFKHDLEALVLASEEALAKRLGLSELKRSWVLPVEDQNLARPPKRVVEDLFQSHGQGYKDTVDAPAILEEAELQIVVERCPQCFAPFFAWLESLKATDNHRQRSESGGRES